ncbi:hypothetical protein ACWD4F_31035 [Streptomyces aureus]
MTELLTALRQIEDLTPQATPTLRYADIAVVLGDTDGQAQDRLTRLDGTIGTPWSTDTLAFVGTAGRLADELTRWRDELGLSGVRLRPAVLPDDADRIIRNLVPLLRPPAGTTAHPRPGGR